MKASIDDEHSHASAFAQRLTLAALIPLLSSCFTLTVDPRALVLQPDGGVRALTLACPPAAAGRREATPAESLDPRSIRLVTWNIHKEGDAGWQKDLTALAEGNDLVLLQETGLQPVLREILGTADLRWVMASSFEYGGLDLGVLTASRVAPVASCTQRVVEPLLRLPKSAIISWFALAGDPRTLAVVNVHAINFSLSIEAYRAQFAGLGDALATHDGPIILAGDLNTWSAARRSVVDDVAARLGLTEVGFAEDKRTLFFGNQLDHILIRGLRVVTATVIEVKSSDHNPVSAVLQRPAQ
ncbi:MAG: endonuclease/exonuclease/phosphatase family protein [Casimicrobiaceae bacterium]